MTFKRFHEHGELMNFERLGCRKCQQNFMPIKLLTLFSCSYFTDTNMKKMFLYFILASHAIWDVPFDIPPSFASAVPRLADRYQHTGSRILNDGNETENVFCMLTDRKILHHHVTLSKGRGHGFEVVPPPTASFVNYLYRSLQWTVKWTDSFGLYWMIL